MPTSSAGHGRLSAHVVDLLRLAGPVVLSRAGMLAMTVVDTVMVGRYATRDLAHLSLAWALIVFVTITTLGLLLGGLVRTSQAFGRGDLRECGLAWRISLPWALILGVAGAAICLLAEPLLLATGQTHELAENAGRVAVIAGLGLPGAAVWFACLFFLEGIRRPVVGMVMMAIANLLNVLLNWLLIYGSLGAPELGADGAAWGTTAARTALGIMAVAVIWWMHDRHRFAVRGPFVPPWRGGREQRRLGYGAGLGIAIESSAFEGMTFLAGWLGHVALAAFAIGFNVLAMFFMMALGLGIATSVRVGTAVGRRDAPDVVLAGWTGLGVNTVLALAASLLLWSQAALVIGFYTGDADVLALAVPLIAYVALVLVFDGGQIVMANACRGRSDVWMPTLVQGISYWGVMLPCGWLFAIHMNRGPAGLFEAILVASVISLALQALRFHVLSHRPLPAQPPRPERA